MSPRTSRAPTPDPLRAGVEEPRGSLDQIAENPSTGVESMCAPRHFPMGSEAPATSLAPSTACGGIDRNDGGPGWGRKQVRAGKRPRGEKGSHRRPRFWVAISAAWATSVRPAIAARELLGSLKERIDLLCRKAEHGDVGLHHGIASQKHAALRMGSVVVIGSACQSKVLW